MTREERIEKLQHLITCMKCEVSGKPCDDNCSTQYNAGNMGEIIENLEEIAKALEQEPILDKPHIEGDYMQGYKNGLRTAEWRYNNAIKEIRNIEYLSCPQPDVVLNDVLQIIDKYKAESEDKCKNASIIAIPIIQDVMNVNQKARIMNDRIYYFK